MNNDAVGVGGDSKLAGLLDSLRQQVTTGVLPFVHLEKFTGLSVGEREKLFGQPEAPKSDPLPNSAPAPEVVPEPNSPAVQAVSSAELPNGVTLVADMGTVTVPADYSHASQLATFNTRYGKHFFIPNKFFTDRNFGNPARVMKPGESFRVKAFKCGVAMTHAERLVFISAQGAVCTGAQGLSVVFDQKWGKDEGKFPGPFPSGLAQDAKHPADLTYVAPDQEEHLWKDDKATKMPCMLFSSDSPGVGAVNMNDTGLAHDLKGKEIYDFGIICFYEVA